MTHRTRHRRQKHKTADSDDEQGPRGRAAAAGSDDPAPDPPGEPVPFRKFVLYFLRLVTTGFGGPIATVGYTQRDLVEHRGWIDRKDFLDGVALGQTMPGPLAAQVAMWVGYLQRGAGGALTVAAAFIAPSFAMVLAAAVSYSADSGTWVVQALFYSIAPAVMAIIAIAAYKLFRLTDRRDWRLWTISAAVFAVTALTGSEPIPLILGAGLAILFIDAPPRWPFRGRWRTPKPPPALEPPGSGAKAFALPALFAVPRHRGRGRRGRIHADAATARSRSSNWVGSSIGSRRPARRALPPVQRTVPAASSESGSPWLGRDRVSFSDRWRTKNS